MSSNSGSPSLSTPLRRERELFWIKELGTAKPYGFNDQIKGVGTLSSTSCKKTNVYIYTFQQTSEAEKITWKTPLQ